MTPEEYIQELLKSMQFDFPVTDAQKIALLRLYLRGEINSPFDKWIRNLQPGRDYVMIAYAGMICGIETDGYTHS